MIRHLIFLVMIILLSCKKDSQTTEQVQRHDSLSNGTSKPTEISKQFEFSVATEQDFIKAKAKFKDKLTQDTINFPKINGEIKLPIEGNKPTQLSFRDTLLHTDDENIREYKYEGQFKQIDHYVVSGTFWEHYEIYLINKNTGENTLLWNNPALSPSNQFIANLSLPFGLEGTPIGIQIWRISKKNNPANFSISKHLEINPIDWAPIDFVWESDKVILLKVAKVDAFLNNNGIPHKNDYYYLKLSF